MLNGVSEAEFEPINHSDARYDLVYLGELRSAKGVDTLIEGLAILKHQHGLAPSILVVGSGPEEEALKGRASILGVGPQMSFEPPGPIRHALSRARIMVIPSRAESLPYVILEAAAACQPLVSTNVGGIPEIYGPAHAHRLIEPNDAAALAAAMAASLAIKPDELTAQARDLSDHVHRHFTLEAMIDGVTAGYRDALAKRRAR